MPYPLAAELSQQESPKFDPQHKVELVDLERATQLAGIVGRKIFVEIAELFAVEARKGLQEIVSALETQSCAQIAKKSHALKSSAATLGCMSLAELLQDIELEAKGPQPKNLSTLITLLKSLMEASLTALSQHTSATRS